MPNTKTHEEVEALLRAKLATDEAETGLYKVGANLGYVVVDRVGSTDEVTFQWFDEALDLRDLSPETKESNLKARCQALLDQGDRVAAVKLYRTETKANLAVAMQELGLRAPWRG